MRGLFSTAAAAVIAASMLPGCAGVIKPVRDAVSPPGQMNADGTVNPCHGYRTDHQGCGNAIYNATVIPKLALGMTIDEARAIIKRQPERQVLEMRNGERYEAWYYLIDYDRAVTTEVVFVSGKLVAKRDIAS